MFSIVVLLLCVFQWTGVHACNMTTYRRVRHALRVEARMRSSNSGNALRDLNFNVALCANEAPTEELLHAIGALRDEAEWFPSSLPAVLMDMRRVNKLLVQRTLKECARNCTVG